MSQETDIERLGRLRQKLSNVPQRPGVYIHRDAGANILYVGKAKNLQSRLRSYFTGLERHGPKTQALVAKISDFEVMLVDNENESLVLENNLIKHYRPPYNFLLRDDKTYPYLKINLKDDWPKVIFTRQRKSDGALYFGPFTEGAGLSALMSVIHRFFPLVKCTPHVFKTVTRPCNYYDVKRCLGPCKLPVEKAHYRGIVDDVIAILQGRTRDVVRSLKNEMNAASENLAFEKAATLRDQIKALESLDMQQSVALEPGFNADILGDYWHPDSVSFYVSQVRDGKLVGGKSFILKRALDEAPEEETLERELYYKREAMSALICQYYQKNDIPDYVFVPDGGKILDDATKDGIIGFLDVIRNKNNEEKPVPLNLFWENKISEKRLRNKFRKDFHESLASLCALSQDNARNRLQEEIKVDEVGQRLLLGLQTFLGIEKMPAWLECYDISNFQGAETVAAGVVFRDGRPAKSEYRRYIIKETVGQPDDFASLREVVRRRFGSDRWKEIPDCLVIDGGEPQVREVGRVLKSLGLDHICFFGIAKSRTQRNFAGTEVRASEERVVFPARRNGELVPEEAPETRFLKVGSPEYRLLTQIRDEAHRFAITFHRKRRAKSGVRSVLNSVEGLGPKRRKALLKVFPSFTEMKQASIEDIANKAGIPVAVAEKLKKAIE